ncbi:DUF485 domain-containing protein [Pontiella sulfatireligans]|uniref:Inner membrane protein YjcH n=1 Tax=Pontiella sulfatireligans TaxID=2750658 RepID=A0A6C2UMX8_9BACT|nr:DUF485 domain-containing protein [Pontiella sulfatireligans]VGO21635.1 hypothetical protein SCARR_03709 [Pontiella sulfatireligans]
MLHEPAAKTEKDAASAWKAKLGIKLFWLYCIIYMGFVGIAVFSPETMKKPVLAGTNLAIVYGMALIIFAIILGLVYNHVCTKKEDELNGKAGEAK